MIRPTPDDFRPDGLRGHCPFCNKNFDMDFGDRLENALTGHSQQCHPETTEKIPDYLRQLYDHVDVDNDNKPKHSEVNGLFLTDFKIDIERIPLFQQNNNEGDYWQPWVNIKREVSGSWTTHFDPMFYSLIFPFPSDREKIQEPSKYLSKEVMFYLDKTKHREEKSLQEWKEEWGLDC